MKSPEQEVQDELTIYEINEMMFIKEAFGIQQNKHITETKYSLKIKS